MRIYTLFSFVVLLILMLSFPACKAQPVISEPATIASSPQPIRAISTPTSTLLPSPSPTDPVQSTGYRVNIGTGIEFVDRTQLQQGEGLKTELYYTGGGGGWGCNFESGELRFPVIGMVDWYTLCIAGFPRDQEILVEIYSPEGTLVSSQYVSNLDELELVGSKIISRGKGFQILPLNEKGDGEELMVDQNAIIQFIDCNLSAPSFFSSGKWKFVASTGNLRAESLINLGKEPYPHIIVLPDLVVDPMNIVTNEFRVGDTVYALGSGFKPKSRILLGIYYLGEDRLPESGTVILEKWLDVNQQGRLGVSFIVQQKDLSGHYYAIARSDNGEKITIITNFEGMQGFAVLNSNPTQNTIPELQLTTLTPSMQCPGAPATNLSANIRAYLQDRTSNRVRENPGLNGAVIGQIKPMEQVDILDGPACADGLLWWKVRTLKTDLIGWTAEGDQQSYWLVPLP